MYHIKTNSKTPLHIQLYMELKKDIISNFKIGEKLPSIRKVASTYNLSKNTVENAYSQLVVEGYIDSVAKSGYVVIENGFKDFSEEFVFKSSSLKESEDEVLYDFFPASLEKSSFPLKLWKRLYSKVVDDSLDMGAYSDRKGELGLREEIARYLNQSRGVRCNPNQIILGNGFISSISLLALLLNKTHKSLAIENPGYHVARRVFENHGYEIEKIAVKSDGVDLEALLKAKSKALYITPSHQYPTGVAIPISNRLKLLQWAQKNEAFLIEDDYDSELSFVNRPIPSLQGLDSSGRVVYIGTFSKALSPALRVSYMLLPKKLLEIYEKNFFYYDSGVCLMIQKTLQKFIADGYWDKHLRKIRTINKKKHNLLKELLEKKLKDSMQIVSQGGGLAILIRANLPLDDEKLQSLAKKEKIKLYFAKQRCGGEWDALMMGFGGFSIEDLEKAVDAFSKIWWQSIKKL